MCKDRLNNKITGILTTAGLILLLDGVVAVVSIGLSLTTLTVPVAVVGGLVAIGVTVIAAKEISDATGDAADCMADIPDMCRGLPLF